MRAALIILVLLSILRGGAFAATVSTGSAAVDCNRVNSAIRKAIHDRFGPDIEVEDKNVVVLANTSALDSTQVAVERMNLDRRNGVIEVRLRCANVACLPFYALVTPRKLPTLSQPGLNYGSLQRSRSSERPVTRVAPAVRAGSRMMLIVSTPTMRLSLPAVSLETRQMGEPVRVRTIGDSRVFHAVVRGPGLAVVQEQ